MTTEEQKDLIKCQICEFYEGMIEGISDTCQYDNDNEGEVITKKMSEECDIFKLDDDLGYNIINVFRSLNNRIKELEKKIKGK